MPEAKLSLLLARNSNRLHVNRRNIAASMQINKKPPHSRRLFVCIAKKNNVSLQLKIVYRMKKISFILLFSAIALSISAQSQSLGLQLGFSRPLLRENSLGETSKLGDITAANGFKAGLVYDATLVKGFGFTIGINYSFAAQKSKWVQESSYYTAKKRQTRDVIHTIELPIEWQYKFTIAQETYLLLYSGPVVQYNFSFKHTVTHKNEAEGIYFSDTYNHYSANNAIDNITKIKYGDIDEDGKQDYTPLNIQWGIGAGFQYKNYFIRGGYNFGIYNHYNDRHYTNPDGTTEYKMRGRWDEWNIRIGIYFLNF